MNATEDTTGNRIGLFFMGLSISAICGVITLGIFGLATMKMDPALAGRDYWRAIWDRLLTAEWMFIILFGMSILGTLLGLLMMAMSFGLGVRKTATGPVGVSL